MESIYDDAQENESVDIKPGSFAEACYEDNSISELREALEGETDFIDCDEWGLTAEQWRTEIATALAALLEDAADESLPED